MPTSIAAATKANPHLDRLGGHDAVVRLVDAFYRAMDKRTDARTLRAMHPADLGQTKSVLTMYLVEWLGGARAYTAERGAPRLGRVHQPYAIDSAARMAWMACMDDALNTVCPDAGMRAELLVAFGKLAVHLQNRHEPHATKADASVAPSGAPSTVTSATQGAAAVPGQ